MKLPALLLVNKSLEGGEGALTIRSHKWRCAPFSIGFDQLALALLVIGIGLRVGQYAIGAALWHDELALARNIVEKPLRELLMAPLDYTQVAPPGFLLVEKIAITSFGNTEYALRLFPLLCALISLPLFANIARRTLRPGAALLAIAMFSLSPVLIGFGSQVKQYAADVAVALVMTALALGWRERRRMDGSILDAALLGTAGFLAVWFSHTAVLVLAGLGTALLLEASWQQERRAQLRKLFPILILWVAGATAVVAYGFQTASLSTYTYMRAYWSEGFIPLSTGPIDSARWLWRAFRGFFDGQFRYPLPWIGALLTVFGAVMIARRARWHALLILAPLGITLVASAARQYPFGDRVSLFLLPFILLLAVEGFDRLRRSLATAWPPLGTILITVATTVPAYALYSSYPLYPEQPMPEVLAYVQARRQPQDAIYVYHGAWHAVGYYGPRYGLSLDAVVLGSCGDPRKLLNDLDQFRGRERVWVLVSHVVGPLMQRETIIRYLDTIGTRHDSIVTLDRASRPSSSAYLYDLSDTGRLRSASAETFMLPLRTQGREYPCIADL